jgi:prepilin-type N-terminal cleavage/methylation domain-containing protein
MKVNALPRAPSSNPKPKITMKIPRLPSDARNRGFTLIELLVVISIIAILAGFALPVFTSAQKKGRITDTLNNAKQTSTALKMYANDHDGSYPYYSNPDDPSTLVSTSNGALELLMPKYSSSKAIFVNKASAWCKQVASGAADSSSQYKLLQGQCDWAYVAGLSETADARWPLLATAFAPASHSYVKQASQKGGVWQGTDAVVVLVDHSAKQISDLKDNGATTFIKRPDLPTANMFDQDQDWLAGDTIKILLPMGG